MAADRSRKACQRKEFDMKIVINRDDLVYAVSAVERAVSAKSTIPALGGVLISAEDDQIGRAHV